MILTLVVLSILVICCFIAIFTPEEDYQKAIDWIKLKYSLVKRWFRRKKTFKTIKPSGTVNLLSNNLSSGIEPYYTRELNARQERLKEIKTMAEGVFGITRSPNPVTVADVERYTRDCISGSFATLNPLDKAGHVNLSNANLTASFNPASRYIASIDPYLMSNISASNLMTSNPCGEVQITPIKNKYRLEYWDSTGCYKTEIKEIECNERIYTWNFDIDTNSHKASGPDFYIIATRIDN